jgi:hypothetical protein
MVAFCNLAIEANLGKESNLGRESNLPAEPSLGTQPNLDVELNMAIAIIPAAHITGRFKFITFHLTYKSLGKPLFFKHLGIIGCQYWVVCYTIGVFV